VGVIDSHGHIGHSDDAGVNVGHDGDAIESGGNANDWGASGLVVNSWGVNSLVVNSWGVNSWALSDAFRAPPLDPSTAGLAPHIAPPLLTQGLPAPAGANDAALAKWTFHHGSSLFSAVIEHRLISVFTLNNVA